MFRLGATDGNAAGPRDSPTRRVAGPCWRPKAVNSPGTAAAAVTGRSGVSSCPSGSGWSRREVFFRPCRASPWRSRDWSWVLPLLPGDELLGYGLGPQTRNFAFGVPLSPSGLHLVPSRLHISCPSSLPRPPAFHPLSSVLGAGLARRSETLQDFHFMHNIRASTGVFLYGRLQREFPVPRGR